MQQFMKIDRIIVVNKTLDWMPADTEEQYQKISKTMKVPYGPGDITYKYNNYGFRCDDFDHWENYPYRILFAGCSITEGIGVPLEDLWAKKLHKMICDKIGEYIPYWTIASGGTGLDHMVRYLHNLKDLLKPQIIISYLPMDVRRERWNEDRWSVWSLEVNSEKHTTILMDENFTSYQTEKNLVMLEMLLEEMDSWFLCSSGHEFGLDRIINKEISLNQIDYGRDGIHAGPKSNEIYSQIAFESFWPIIEEKLNLTNKK